MKLACRIMLVLFMVPFLGTAQESEEPKSQMVEIIYLKPAKGKAQMLIKAIKEHNKKYHAQGPYSASLNTIVTGNDAGWMVWEMGRFSYTELDNAPGEGAHMDNWRETVEPYVGEYGRVEHWRNNKALSNSGEGSKKFQEIWFMNLERGEYYRFKEFMTKAQKIFAEKNDAIGIWGNEFGQADGRDIAMVFPFDKWGDRDIREWNMKDEFETMYGKGSWENAMDEWEDFISDMKVEVWREL